MGKKSRKVAIRGMMMEYDYINPSHYQKEGKKECIEYIRMVLGTKGAIFFCLGNAMKYIYRCGNKPNEDVERELQKIRWYEDKAEEISRNVGNPPWYKQRKLLYTNWKESMKCE